MAAAPCLALPHPPPLPNILPITLTPPQLPTIDLSVDFCCKINIVIPLPQIPLGPLVIALPPEVMITLNAIMVAVNSVIDALTLSCPFDPVDVSVT